MDAMTTPSILIQRLEADYPQFSFVADEDFKWSHAEKTIHYPKNFSQADTALILHELAHALLDHKNYKSDVELLKIERQAWELAVDKLAPKYKIKLSFEDEIVQEALDSYRDWLHSRSVCPECQAVGTQEANRDYRCINCNQRWRPNEARVCELRRYKK